MVDEAEERELLRQAAACAGSRFIVSYSRIELGTGRARVPSLYVYEVMRAARGSAFDPRELQREAEAEFRPRSRGPLRTPCKMPSMIRNTIWVFFANPSRPGR